MHNTAHDMYLPDRRARKAEPKHSTLDPAPEGPQAVKEAWMRKRQVAREQQSRRATRDKVERIILEVCRRAELTKGMLLSGSRLPHICAARGEICRQLHAIKVSTKEIGCALKIHHSSVIYHLAQSPPRPVEPIYDPDQPDESGVWNI